jgi:P pilus assembly chaperone PapD
MMKCLRTACWYNAQRWSFAVLSLLLFSPVVYSAVEKKGLTFQSTRVIYPVSALGGVSFGITNNTSTTYLMQSRVRDWGTDPDAVEHAPAPFVVLPPLEKLGAGDKLNLRIRLMRNDLPRDRESVFSLALKAIPAKQLKDTHAGTALTLATQHQFKLFYRPEGLPGYSSEQVAAKLHFSTQGRQLQVENPTPYYATFATLTVGGRPVDTTLAIMIPPFSRQTYPLLDAGHGDIAWQLVDDNGVATPERTQIFPQA